MNANRKGKKGGRFFEGVSGSTNGMRLTLPIKTLVVNMSFSRRRVRPSFCRGLQKPSQADVCIPSVIARASRACFSASNSLQCTGI